MSRLTIVDRRVCLRFSRAEKVLGVLRDLDVPLDRVVSAEPLRESWWRGARLARRPRPARRPAARRRNR